MIAKWRDETFNEEWKSFERKRDALRFTSGHGFHAEPLFISAFATLSPFRLSKKAFTCQSECRGNWVWNAGDWASTSIGYFGARLKIKPKQSSGKSWQIWNTFNLWPQQIIITMPVHLNFRMINVYWRLKSILQGREHDGWQFPSSATTLWKKGAFWNLDILSTESTEYF